MGTTGITGESSVRCGRRGARRVAERFTDPDPRGHGRRPSVHGCSNPLGLPQSSSVFPGALPPRYHGGQSPALGQRHEAPGTVYVRGLAMVAGAGFGPATFAL